MPLARSIRTRRLFVRPILGCALVAACAVPATAQTKTAWTSLNDKPAEDFVKK